jgi:hypothetical protein
MNPRKRASAIRGYAIGAAISAFILFSPIVAFLTLIAAEAAIDLLRMGGAGAVCAIAAGAIGLVLFRKFWRRAPVSGAVEGKFGRTEHDRHLSNTFAVIAKARRVSRKPRNTRQDRSNGDHRHVDRHPRRVAVIE